MRNNKSFVSSNITIDGNSQLLANRSHGEIAGVLKNPTIVNLTP